MTEANYVFYNHGKDPIFISHKIKVDPFGGPGTMDEKILIMPGQGIDISILNLLPTKPEKK